MLAPRLNIFTFFVFVIPAFSKCVFRDMKERFMEAKVWLVQSQDVIMCVTPRLILQHMPGNTAENRWVSHLLRMATNWLSKARIDILNSVGSSAGWSRGLSETPWLYILYSPWGHCGMSTSRQWVMDSHWLFGPWFPSKIALNDRISWISHIPVFGFKRKNGNKKRKKSE